MIKRATGLAGCVLLASSLAGCAVAPPDFNALAGDDVALRHPIELRQGWQELILPFAQRFDERAKEQLASFVADWRRFGSGPIFVRVADSKRDEKVIKAQLGHLRAALVAEGLHQSVKLIREPLGETDRTPLLRLSFIRMKAEVVTRCGRWPENLASSADTQWDNRVYSNFGCAYQNMIASQTADPRDLVGVRAESPIDAQMRVRALNRLREERSIQGGVN
jgi:pilus assembly protein CpaD